MFFHDVESGTLRDFIKGQVGLHHASYIHDTRLMHNTRCHKYMTLIHCSLLFQFDCLLKHQIDGRAAQCGVIAKKTNSHMRLSMLRFYLFLFPALHIFASICQKVPLSAALEVPRYIGKTLHISPSAQKLYQRAQSNVARDDDKTMHQTPAKEETL